MNYCQGCGAATLDLIPLQDPNCLTLRGAVRHLCKPCVPGWEREKWSRILA